MPDGKWSRYVRDHVQKAGNSLLPGNSYRVWLTHYWDDCVEVELLAAASKLASSMLVDTRTTWWVGHDWVKLVQRCDRRSKGWGLEGSGVLCSC